MSASTSRSEAFHEADVASHIGLLGERGDRAEERASTVQDAAESFARRAKAFARDYLNDRAADPRELLVAYGVMRAALDRLVDEVEVVEDHLKEVPFRVGGRPSAVEVEAELDAKEAEPEAEEAELEADAGDVDAGAEVTATVRINSELLSDAIEAMNAVALEAMGQVAVIEAGLQALIGRSAGRRLAARIVAARLPEGPPRRES